MPATPAMTLGQLIDLVAYLKSQGGDAGHAHEESREQIAGGYRVRLAFVPAATSVTPTMRIISTERARHRPKDAWSSSSRTPPPARPFRMRR